ncbi:hypothetical protein [Polluticoccus soli]|uniref:hypothetical protein n=1 Tax=Polluticoccus soli TaxID=3034150 RepID=UPI0023E12CAD|nr:hypothetical protein [Flavipsychrobacter sp. JY13-12]
MKKIFTAAAIALLSIGSLSLTSCDKDEDEGLLPKIEFKTTQGYTSSDATVARKTAVKIGINAEKTEDKDVLTKFTITRSRNNGAESTVYTQNLTGVDGDKFSYDYNITTEDAAAVDKYTFAVVNRDGLINKVSLTLTVQ